MITGIRGIVTMNIDAVPRTLAVIPDGNRRWSTLHKLSVLNGYDIGVKKFIEFSGWCRSYGINSVTVWAFSSDNLSRPKREVDALFSIYKRAATDRKLIADLHKNEIRIKIVGDTTLLPDDLSESLRAIETETGVYTKNIINLLIGYGGREDILHAAKRAASEFVKRGSARFEEIFERSLLSYGIPAIDLVIRTSGERRLSGFMPWQSSYSELYFSKKLWPEFTKNDLRLALLDYSKRERRFGR